MIRKKFEKMIGIYMILFVFISLNGCANTPANVQAIDIDDVDGINISYSSDNVTFYESETQQLVIKEYMNKNNAKYSADISISGNYVIIESGDRPLGFQSYVEVYLPNTYNGNLSVNTENGAIIADKSFTLDEVNIGADNGALHWKTLLHKEWIFKQVTAMLP